MVASVGPPVVEVAVAAGVGPPTAAAAAAAAAKVTVVASAGIPSVVGAGPLARYTNRGNVVLLKVEMFEDVRSRV
ncbi:hypothetical protein GUJ93_ZPchr0014g46511 [Zizania palustris]|uniref:Uncharacterized protein n=1 Tax=Zizania palustris TaxID=103762 RepID=A0A8J5W608_ZIZPA|nr:hypothetical protein GUJ93_ZPchr0014g46511 [Zizania palustris]